MAENVQDLAEINLPLDSQAFIRAQLIFGLDGGDLPEIVVTDTGSYSGMVFGLLSCWASPTGPRSRTCLTRKAGGSRPTPTTGR
jgi:hypothetical protein